MFLSLNFPLSIQIYRSNNNNNNNNNYYYYYYYYYNYYHYNKNKEIIIVTVIAIVIVIDTFFVIIVIVIIILDNGNYDCLLLFSGNPSSTCDLWLRNSIRNFMQHNKQSLLAQQIHEIW